MNRFGLLLIVATTLFPAYQLFTLPGIPDKVALFSQYLGLAALILMAWGMIWATRMPGVEALFGGLDRVYVLHKWAGIVAMVAILVHDTVDAEIDGVGQRGPLNDLAETVGEISLYGLLILVVISIATFIPYHLWKWTHKLMGALFIAGAFHFVYIEKPFAMGEPAGLYTGLFCLAGTLAYLWTLIPEHRRMSHAYDISEIEKTGGSYAITMAPRKKGIRPQPGQFGVIRFEGSGQVEQHPFSFSKIGADGSLRVTIKALGDFTTQLPKALKAGQEVRIQGPFGRFRMKGKGTEVWIAGGIGITPFVAWSDALTEGATVHLFYCFRSEKDAAHLEEIKAFASEKPNLNLHIVSSKEGKRLSAELIAETVGEDIAKAKVSFCGPVPLREMLQKELRRYGVTARDFHFEEFEFRTGIGLKKLAAWILSKKTT